MEAAVAQLIKTAIIKAGNGLTLFVAAAQHYTAAGWSQICLVLPNSDQISSAQPSSARLSYVCLPVPQAGPHAARQSFS